MRVSAFFVAGLAAVATALPVESVVAKAAIPATATSSAAEPTSTPDGLTFIHIPSSLLKNASKTLDYVIHRLTALRNTVEKTAPEYGFVPHKTARRITNMLRTPMETLVQILESSTAISKTVGLNSFTPVDEKDTIYSLFEPPCNGTCLLTKANQVVDEISKHDRRYAHRIGMDEVGPMVHSVKDAATELVKQLGGQQEEEKKDMIEDMMREEEPEPQPESTMTEAPRDEANVETVAGAGAVVPESETGVETAAEADGDAEDEGNTENMGNIEDEGNEPTEQVNMRADR
ncbi:hypothetical protein Sste5346_005245 [Sporothrix stenoceras]|uniref:Cell wall protein n=1 Tax=Sporothrix stenoceras TaxID=5173 RepID=A0ABR3Z5C4_9PEZI